MLAIRDQENLVHGHQTTAAAKPLNQGVRGIAPKTPGPNGWKAAVGGKITARNNLKDDENMIFGGGKKGNADKQAFVTPLAPRDRAPLGAKTANAKGHAFKTPAPQERENGLQKTQKRTTSARKTKLKIHQPEVMTQEPTLRSTDNEVPDIEYCPPKITELPDLPDDPYIFDDFSTFPQFDPRTLFAGAFDPNDNPVEADGRTRRQREAAEAEARYCAEKDEEYRIQAQQLLFGATTPIANTSSARAAPSKRSTAPLSQVKRKHTGPSSLDAQSAAAALSSRPIPRFAAATAATRARATKSTTAPTPPVASTSSRSPISSASRATIGYSAGRKVSSSLRPFRDSSDVPASTKPIGRAALEQGRGERQTERPRSEDEILQELLWGGGDGLGFVGEESLENDLPAIWPGTEEDDREVFQLDPTKLGF